MYAESDNTTIDIQLCNDNNDSPKPDSTENMENGDVCNDSVKILNCDEPKTEKMNDLDEFEQVLSEYKEKQRNCNNNTDSKHLKTTNESIDTETIIDMGIDIAETTYNANKCKTRQVDVDLNEVCINNSETPDMNENLSINSTQDNIIKEETLQYIITEVDLVSLSSNEELNINESDQNFDPLSNTLASNNKSKSIEIEIDIKNEIADQRFVNSSFLEDFEEAGPSGLNHTNFEIDDIKLCDDLSINDMNAIIDLTDSPNNTLSELETAKINVETIHNVTDIIKIENISDFENFGNETKNVHLIDSESDCSFHSSDFELITEEEARMDGFMINFRAKKEINNENAYNNENIIDMCLPGPSNDYAYRENHRIPEGDEFFNMFHGVYAPANIPDLIFLENKSVVPSQCMNVERDNFGFDYAALNKEVIDKEYQDEAKETAKKILNSYHDDERKRFRRPL